MLCFALILAKESDRMAEYMFCEQLAAQHVRINPTEFCAHRNKGIAVRPKGVATHLVADDKNDIGSFHAALLPENRNIG